MKLSSKYVLKVHLTDDFVSLCVIQIVAKVEQDLIGSSQLYGHGSRTGLLERVR
jgi:hypothetical protein